MAHEPGRVSLTNHAFLTSGIRSQISCEEGRVKQCIRVYAHYGLANKIIRPEFPVFPVAGDVCCRKRLGGLLRYYYRKAA